PIPPTGQDYDYHRDDLELCRYDFARVSTTGIRQDGNPAEFTIYQDNYRYDVRVDHPSKVGVFWITVDDDGHQRNGGDLNVIRATRQSPTAVYIYNNNGEAILLRASFTATLGSAVGTAALPFIVVDADPTCGAAAIVPPG